MFDRYIRVVQHGPCSLLRPDQDNDARTNGTRAIVAVGAWFGFGRERMVEAIYPDGEENVMIFPQPAPASSPVSIYNKEGDEFQTFYSAHNLSKVSPRKLSRGQMDAESVEAKTALIFSESNLSYFLRSALDTLTNGWTSTKAGGDRARRAAGSGWDSVKTFYHNHEKGCRRTFIAAAFSLMAFASFVIERTFHATEEIKRKS